MAHVTLRIAVYTNGDDAFVAWAPSAFIPGCRGFMLERARKTPSGVVVEPVENRLGFKRDKPRSGDHRPSSEWPFQRFNWTDHVVDVGNEVRYRATAMLAAAGGGSGPFTGVPPCCALRYEPLGRPGGLMPSSASRWTRWARLTPRAGGGVSCFFNRGIVLSQFVARYLADHHLTPAAFKAQLKSGTDPAFRAFLEGDLGARLRQLLAAKGTTLYAALYELDDAQLEDALIAHKPPIQLVLANGSDKSGDGNAASRARLNAAGIATTDRLLKSKGLGHNKFAVASKAGVPAAVWTGSTNWTTTGLCTQINNALLIENKAVAALYRAQWDRLVSASPPQGIDADLGPWIAEVTRRDFLNQIGHAIVHSKVLVIDALSADPIVVTGSHNFSAPASANNDENLVVVRGHKALARAYATHVMAVYQHYRYRSYVREMRAQGKSPWAYLDDDDAWLQRELVSKALEIGLWA